MASRDITDLLLKNNELHPLAANAEIWTEKYDRLMQLIDDVERGLLDVRELKNHGLDIYHGRERVQT